jgi:probable O-glycosylation ligase (exosortase A-associated)
LRPSAAGIVQPRGYGALGRRATAPAPVNAVPGEPPAEKVKWTLPLIGLLIYTLFFTSLRVPLGDVAIGVALLGMLLEPKAFRFPVPVRMLALFGLWVLAMSFQSAYPEWVSKGLMDLLKLWLIVLVGYNALQTRAQIRLFMIFFLACFALFPVRGTLVTFFILGEGDREGRAIWIALYSNANDLAIMVLLQLSMLTAFLVTEKKKWLRSIGTIGMIVLPLIIILTQSRGVFLGMVAFLACVFTTQKKKLKLAFQLFVVGLVLLAVAPDSAWDRVRTLKHVTNTEQLVEVDGEGGSARQRFEIWRLATRIISKNPITGVGYRAYKPAHYDNWSPDLDPSIHAFWDTHNLYLNVTAETGFPGVILYFAAVLTVLIPAERVRQACKRKMPDAARQLLFLEAGVIGYYIACVFGSLAYLPHLHLHMVLLYSLAMVNRKQLRGDTMPRMRGFRGAAGNMRMAGRFA